MASEYWYKWFPAKYRRDTRHLTHEQHGIYRMLIDEYMETGQSLPDDDLILAAIVRLSLQDWLKHSTIIRKYFEPFNGSLKLKRCEILIGGYDAMRSKNANNGKVGGQKSGKARLKTYQPIDNKQQRSGRFDQPQAVIEAERGEEKEEKEENRKKDSKRFNTLELSRTESNHLFCELWDAYPGWSGKDGGFVYGTADKGSRKKAEEKFYNLLKKEKDYEGFTGKIIAAARDYDGYLQSVRWKSSQHLITWLNQEGWNTDYSIREAAGGRSQADAIAQGMLQSLREDGGE